MPTTMIHQRPSAETPEATTPQAKAHIGGNQVIGFRSSATADSAGRAMPSILHLTLRASTQIYTATHGASVDRARLVFARRCSEIADVEAAQLDVEALPREAEHLGRRSPVVVRQLERGLDA